jgi:hypothetical protein
MNRYHTILTHPGGAHKDEFLACSVLVALEPVRIVRRDPTAADLADPAICVVDVGHGHDPALNNFDHHQLPVDQPPTSALSLVLKHVGIYEDAREFCEWLETAEWFDCRGPIETAAWLGIDSAVLPKLDSPIDRTLLKRFSLAREVQRGEPLWEILRMIGDDLLTYVRTLRERLEYLAQHAQFWDVPNGAGSMKILFLPRKEPLLDDPGFGMDRFIERRALTAEIAGLVYPDRRGSGYGLSRFRDDPRLDFTRIAAAQDVHFAHARGFVAKTSASEVQRLQELIRDATRPAAP